MVAVPCPKHDDSPELPGVDFLPLPWLARVMEGLGADHVSRLVPDRLPTRPVSKRHARCDAEVPLVPPAQHLDFCDHGTIAPDPTNVPGIHLLRVLNVSGWAESRT